MTQAYLVSNRASAQARSLLVASGRRLAATVAEQARAALESGDPIALRALAERTATQSDVVYCRLFDRSGLLLAASGLGGGRALTGGQEGPIEVAPGLWAFAAPVPGTRDGPIGIAEVALSTAELTALRHRLLTTAVVLTLGVLLAAVVAAVALARAITGPLAALAAAADHIGRGDLDASVRVSTRDEIGTLAASFNHMVERLAQSRAALVDKVHELERVNRLKSEFVATVSHELRTPLNVILGYLEMLSEGAEGPLTPGQRALVATIEHYSLLQLALVTDVLDFSRLASGKVALHVERFELRPLLDEITGGAATRAAGNGVRLVTDVAADLPALETDRLKLQEVIRNLVDNALKFTPAGAVIVTAQLVEDGERVAIEVRDTGVGIDPEDVPHVFEPFYQGGRSSTRSTGGVGLGLSIAQQRVALLGGEISVSSTLGTGSTFRVVVPVRPPSGVAADGTTIVIERAARTGS
ncbi:MAG TPA: ATP-binding protein [Candidatus Limnocylindria bacterium]|nr:ATP-binding protein [Candidatus Limnocylindria bacterium]